MRSNHSPTINVEALRIAADLEGSTEDILLRAKAYADFIATGEVKNSSKIIDLNQKSVNIPEEIATVEDLDKPKPAGRRRRRSK